MVYDDLHVSLKTAGMQATPTIISPVLHDTVIISRDALKLTMAITQQGPVVCYSHHPHERWMCHFAWRSEDQERAVMRQWRCPSPRGMTVYADSKTD